MEENSMSKAQLLFNSVREIKIAVNALEKFADVVKGEDRPRRANQRSRGTFYRRLSECFDKCS